MRADAARAALNRMRFIFTKLFYALLALGLVPLSLSWGWPVLRWLTILFDAGLAPAMFGLRLITFWQALGILILCRILFGGFGMLGGSGRSPRRGHMGDRIADRVADRMAERCENMTPEERERFRQRVRERWGGGQSPGETTPL